MSPRSCVKFAGMSCAQWGFRHCIRCAKESGLIRDGDVARQLHRSASINASVLDRPGLGIGPALRAAFFLFGH
jgi:hypothetical protein